RGKRLGSDELRGGVEVRLAGAIDVESQRLLDRRGGDGVMDGDAVVVGGAGGVQRNAREWDALEAQRPVDVSGMPRTAQRLAVGGERQRRGVEQPLVVGRSPA